MEISTACRRQFELLVPARIWIRWSSPPRVVQFGWCGVWILWQFRWVRRRRFV